MEDPVGIGGQNDIDTKHVTVKTTNSDQMKTKQIKENLEKYEQLFGADEDAFVQPTTTRKELWSYYLYYNVCSETRYPGSSKRRISLMNR
jgi:hypothetical protein